MGRRRKQKPKKQKNSFLQPLIHLGLGVVVFLSLISFRQHDIEANWLGQIGFAIGYVMTYLLGLASYAVPMFLVWTGMRILLRKERPNFTTWTLIATFTLSLGLSLTLIAAHNVEIATRIEPVLYKHYLGGAPLYYLYLETPLNLHQLLGTFGTSLASIITLFLSFMLLFKLPFSFFGRQGRRFFLWIKECVASGNRHRIAAAAVAPSKPFKERGELHRNELQGSRATQEASLRDDPLQKRLAVKLAKEPRPRKMEAPPQLKIGDYLLPHSSLLTEVQPVDHGQIKSDLKRQAEVLEETLLSFGIEAKVGDIHCGPTITSFEVHPAFGVKVQKIKALEKDIALNMQAHSIRIIAPIPGKAAVGIEVPNPHPQEVSFRELLEHYQSGGRKMHIPLLLGKVVNGDDVFSDLAKMPHLIIAGATGSGKSVCINTIVMSIVMNARPDEIKLVMVDPKKVELTAYTHLPHMLAPVITEPGGALAALNWLVKEMERRYEIFRQLGIRNIQAFNGRKPNVELEASLDLDIPEKMPFIVVIIDELADLMIVASTDIETPIARIAQMARAVGIHMILATQRPSREVITGLIKANFPCRIAFKVSSRINSQIIIDETGADTLLGNGDMLFLPPGTSTLSRAQGAFIRDEDINDVIHAVCKQAPTNYLIPNFDTYRDCEELMQGEEDPSDRDPLYEEAKKLVLDTGTASTTFIQRKLKIGYARAASLMDQLEEQGIIGPSAGAKARKIYYPETRD